MRAGPMRHKVKVQSASNSTGAFGTDPSAESYSTISTQRARIRPLSGRELFQARQFHAEVSTEINLRYNSDISGISPKHRIVNANSTGRVYDVLSAINVDERNHEIRVLAKELV